MSAANGTTPLREKIQFPVNTPVILKLDYDEGQLSQGRFGDQMQRVFDNNTRIAWLEIEVDELIKQSGAKAGDEIGITKRETQTGSKRRVTWEVQKVEAEPENHPANRAYNAEADARANQDTRPRAARAASPRSAPPPQPAPPLASQPRPVNEDRKQLPIDNARVEATLHEARSFADCLAAAAHATMLYNIEAKAQGIDFEWDKADVRTIATTLFINRAGGRK